MSDEHQVGDIWTGEGRDGRLTTHRVTEAVAPRSAHGWLIALDGGDICHVGWWHGQGYDGPDLRARLAEIEAERDAAYGARDAALGRIESLAATVRAHEDFAERDAAQVATLTAERDALRARVAELEAERERWGAPA